MFKFKNNFNIFSFFISLIIEIIAIFYFTNSINLKETYQF
ncbi:putative membrane protein [Candidatus Phytoplasma solani]